MKATCTTSDLRAAVAFCQKAAARNASIPVLAHALVKADGDALTIHTADLDVWATATAPATAEVAGVALVPVADLSAFLRVAPTYSVVALSEVTGGLSIDCGSCSIILPIRDAAEFPLTMKPVETQQIDPDVFCGSLDAVQAAMSTDTTRYFLCGVYLDGDRMVATDGVRIHEAHCPCPAKTLIHARHVPLVSRLLAGGGRFGSDGSKWTAEADDKTLVGRCIEGAYPDYRKLIETPDVVNARQVGIVDRDAAIVAVNQATIGDARGVRVEGAGEHIVISTVGSMSGNLAGKFQSQGSASCSAEVLSDFVGHVSGRSVIDALNAMPDAGVAMFRRDSDPQMLIFRPADSSAFQDRRAIIVEFLA